MIRNKFKNKIKRLRSARYEPLIKQTLWKTALWNLQWLAVGTQPKRPASSVSPTCIFKLAPAKRQPFGAQNTSSRGWDQSLQQIILQSIAVSQLFISKTGIICPLLIPASLLPLNLYRVGHLFLCLCSVRCNPVPVWWRELCTSVIHTWRQ